MPNTATSEIPRRTEAPQESARAKAAKTAYITMGPERSLEKVGQKYAKSVPLLKRWSALYNWQEEARRWDDQQLFIARQMAGDAYRRDLEAHREKAMRAGSDLFTVAQALLVQCGRAIRGERIEGKDGKTYIIPAMELTPSTLTTVTRALTTALDLEAHALRIADLLPRLTDESDSQ